MVDYTKYNFVSEDEVYKHTCKKIEFITSQDLPYARFNEAGTKLVRRKVVEELTLQSKHNVRPEWLTLTALKAALNNEGIISDVDDIIDYYNECLNKQQRHQVLINIHIHELMDDVEEFDGQKGKLKNPYTGEPYRLEDASMNDPYVVLFFKKLKDMDYADQTKVYQLIDMAVIMNNRQLIDTTHQKSYVDAIFKDLIYVSDLLIEATDGTGAEVIYMTQDVHDKLREAVDLTSKAIELLKKARDSKETKLYSMENDPRYFGTVKAIAISVEEVIERFNNELNKAEKQEVYALYVVNDIRNPKDIRNERLSTLFWLINNLKAEEHARLLEAFEFWEKTGRGELIDVSNSEDLMNKIAEQADSLFKRCAESYVACIDARSIKPGLKHRASMLSVAANATADVSSYIRKAFDK